MVLVVGFCGGAFAYYSSAPNPGTREVCNSIRSQYALYSTIIYYSHIPPSSKSS